MRTFSMFVALGLSATFAIPAAAEFRFSARVGSGGSSVTIQKGGAVQGQQWRHQKPGRRSHQGSRPYPYYPAPYYRTYREEYVERPPERVEPPAIPAPPVAVAPVEPPPPDPRGPVRLTARGAAPNAVQYNVGEALPSSLPHVTLDWRKYELPEPPPGQIYARVGRDVLLITAVGRIVESVVPPG